MRFRAKRQFKASEPDMTPMIDIVFQLLAFFMVVVNFAEADQNDAVKLPSSELAKPPEGPLESPLFVHLMKDGTVIFTGRKLTPGGFEDELRHQKEIIKANPEKSVAKSTIIIRADKNAKTGNVQGVIMICQKVGFEKFALRAKYEGEM